MNKTGREGFKTRATLRTKRDADMRRAEIADNEHATSDVETLAMCTGNISCEDSDLDGTFDINIGTNGIKHIGGAITFKSGRIVTIACSDDAIKESTHNN